MRRDEMVSIVARLSRDDRKEFLNHLLDEMHSRDIEEVLLKYGFVLKDDD